MAAKKAVAKKAVTKKAVTKKAVTKKAVTKTSVGDGKLAIAAYVARLEPERRQTLEAVLALIRKRMPRGYEETLQYGMPTWVVPLRTFPQGYLGKQDVPLPYVSLAAQKGHLAVYLMGVNGDKALLAGFEAAWKKSGKKLDMGKSCVRFKSVDELDLPTLGEAIAALSPEAFVVQYERSRR